MRKRTNAHGGQMEENKIEMWAFIGPISFIEKPLEDVFCFKLSELCHKYVDRLVALRVQKEVNEVRFKEEVPCYFPQDQMQSDGMDVVLIFHQDMKQILKHAATDYEGDVAILAKASNII
ncbi:hypothetical protein NDU88_000189 [Pleurodeles waltl]|uniref:Uncharacterized protein n=1 Tax=Pleurodeles waltl TaxID=8319 RepID=A0AAV7WHF4_PLEWA|nr:hypothetical protein NDU88_000189 [Pleurodeles waltl]